MAIVVDTEGASWGYDTAWLFFALGCLVCVLVWFFVPEPSKRNYAEMDEMYTNIVSVRKEDEERYHRGAACTAVAACRGRETPVIDQSAYLLRRYAQ